MIKISLRNPYLFVKLMRIPVLNRFFVYNLAYVDLIEDPILCSSVYSSFKTESFNRKITISGRFADIDKITVNYINKFKHPIIHDIAVSSGITSCELLREMQASGVSADFFISDKYSIYYLSGKKIIYIYDRNKNFLFGYIYSFYGSNNISYYGIGSILLYYILKIIPDRQVNLKKIILFDTETKKILNNGNFISIDYDVTSTIIDCKFTFVRCMNLLNKGSWISDDKIILSLKNIKMSLKENGILQIGKTEDITEINRVSYYVKNNDKFILLEHLNGGSELANIMEFI